MYSFNEYWNAEKKYEFRWNSSDRSFSRPEYQIAKPLEQCSFVMTRLNANKKPYPVDIWGSPVDPSMYGTADFLDDARPLWVDGQGSFFDGYSIALSNDPNPVYFDGKEYFVVIGVYESCVTWKDGYGTFSSEFEADRMVLGDPLIWFTPDRKGMCWAGLSEVPIMGGSCHSKKISSFNISAPITSFFVREGVDENSAYEDFLTPLPRNAEKIINKWFSGKGCA